MRSAEFAKIPFSKIQAVASACKRDPDDNGFNVLNELEALGVRLTRDWCLENGGIPAAALEQIGSDPSPGQVFEYHGEKLVLASFGLVGAQRKAIGTCGTARNIDLDS